MALDCRRFKETAELTAALYASLVDHLDRTGRLRTKPLDAAAWPDATIADLSKENLDLFLSRAQSQRGYPLPPGTPSRPHSRTSTCSIAASPAMPRCCCSRSNPSGSC